MTRLDRKQREQAAVLDQTLARKLLTGNDYFGDLDAWDDSDLQQAWQLIAPPIMPRWLIALPGSRPWGWWLFQSPEPRKQTAGPPCQGQANWFGIPSRYHHSCRFEAEADYLRRLKLLEPGEQLAIRTAAEDPDSRKSDAIAELLQLFPE